jgi:hypothetical protein
MKQILPKKLTHTSKKYVTEEKKRSVPISIYEYDIKQNFYSSLE